MTAAALLFSVALGAFGVWAIDFVELLVVGSVLAVLIHATIVRALLVPAVFGLVGEARLVRAGTVGGRTRPTSRCLRDARGAFSAG